MTVALVTAAVAASSGASSTFAPPRFTPPAPERCLDGQRGIRFYRAAFTETRAKMGAPGAPPRRWYDCETTRRRAGMWRDRAARARVELTAWVEYHYDWRQWLPAKWRRVATCETHLNWFHSNGSFVSAFGISRAAYRQDAAVMGAPPWNDRRPPTPREQYLAALGHYRLHYGFSGWGCRGA